MREAKKRRDGWNHPVWAGLRETVWLSVSIKIIRRIRATCKWLASRISIRREFRGPLLLIGTIILSLFMAEALSRLLLTEESSSIINLQWGDNHIPASPFRKEGGAVIYHEPFSTRFSTKKPPGTFRVIFLGDSMTYGVTEGELEGSEGEIVDEDLFTTLLEGLLNQSLQTDGMPVRRYEILNFGKGGYALPQIEQVFYEALAFKPDLLIYNYFVDDLDTLSLVRSLVEEGYESQDGDWLLSYEQSVPYLFQFPGNGKLLLHSWAFRFLNKGMRVVIQKLDPEFTPNSFDIGWERAEQSLNGMITAARKEQLPFVIMLSPDFTFPEITGSYGPEDFIMENCHSGLLVWDVSRELAPFYSSEELRINEDGPLHDLPNRVGHVAIAEALQLYFERYILNRSSLEHLVPVDSEEVPCKVV